MLDAFRPKVQLKPIYDRKGYSEPVEAEIIRLLRAAIYFPLIAILKSTNPDVREAARLTAVIAALKDGRIRYDGRRFTGQFSAAVSRQLAEMGATYSKGEKGFVIESQRVPVEVKAAVAQGKMLAKEQADAMLAELDRLQRTAAPVIRLEERTRNTSESMERQFEESVPKDLSVPMRTSPAVVERISLDYTNNLDLGIQKWYTEAIERLRVQVQSNAAEGFRADRMQQVLESDYGVTRSRAKFLARQETSLFVSKFRQARYEESGITQYRWSTSHDERVRPDHAALNGRVFRFDDPPVVDRSNGRHGNPGEDFGCRCVAVPIVRMPA